MFNINKYIVILGFYFYIDNVKLWEGIGVIFIEVVRSVNMFI